jgi:hypothetical protein
MAKKLNPQEQQRVQQRKAFVQAHPDLDPAVARKRFFVQTRVQELTRSGIDVTDQLRAGLREQFTSGNVKRQGFYTPKDIANSRNNNNNNNNNNTNNTVDSPPTKIPGGVGAAAARARGMVNNTTPITYGPRTTTSGTTPTSSSTSTTTPSATPKKDRNPFNDPGSPFTKAEQDKFKTAIAENFKDYKGSKTEKVVSFVGDTLELGNFAKAAKFIGKTILDTGDSFNATFVNPAANLVGQKVFNKNPNLREAGLLESTLTTADTIAAIYSAGGSKVIGTAAASAAKRFGFRQTEKTALTKVESAALRSQAPGASRSPSRTPKVEPEFIPGGLNNPIPFKNKPGTKPPKTKPSTVTEVKGEKAVPKPTSKKTKAPKVESTDPVVGKTDKDLAAYSDTGPTGPIDMSSTRIPKAEPTPDVAPDVTPAVNSAKRVEWVRQNNPIAEPLNLDPIPDTVQTSPAPTVAKPTTPKPTTPKPTTPKPTTPKPKKPKTPAPATSLSRPITGSRKAPVETHANAGREYPTTTNFTTKQGYDNWLATGGRIKLQEMGRSNPNDLIKFYQRNQRFIRSREAANQAAKDVARKAEAETAEKVIAHENAIKAGTPEASPAVQEAAKLKAAEVPTAPKAKTEPAKKPAKKPAGKKKKSGKKNA